MNINCLVRRQFPLKPITCVHLQIYRNLSHTIIPRSIDDSKDPLNSKSQKKIEPEQPAPESFPRTKTKVDNFLEKIRPHLNTIHQQYDKTHKQINNIITPVKFHYNKAKTAINEVNEKLALQEKESESYSFKQDLTNGNSSEIKDKTIQGLPSERERKRKKWAKKLELYIDSLQETIFTATRALNDVTGYSSIQKLRESIEILEKDLHNTKELSKVTKDAYSAAISKRLQTQKEVNELLQRQHTWSPQDLDNFTKLYKDDHENATWERKAKEEMEAADAREEDVQNRLSKAILTRYHEEQIWSDKIRRTSTWGTFGLMGINILLFLVFQLALEPWKRRRLVGNFEEKVQQVLEENAYLQNKKLDLMNKKVESLKNSELYPVLNESGRAEIIEDPIEPPTVGTLPSPPIRDSIRDKTWLLINNFINLFKPSYNLITTSGSSVQATLKKEEVITFSSVILVLGITTGSIISSIWR
ncbi:Sensitive to high expression protein,mitochondrial [Wickerhamomyces ciferrii]|uniref:Sensitive to high expression protein 9, mitochondrial n=1 Tax=Wickerhamomyces ciferrii (strain ATCC 14091 / BCRC 22168 / CBS 111 / JCM 3599 / NBRC 0793 / NRRL Y-1031 F-60-10) TaxID=1206466 RepID=K0KQS2_WICCF|nr:Sensitive to high expression protein,mitochondrial [Wickerhamomyces ciferrii]CCH43679.1 Sensitive to high expression protein,mitochondrial [Wickerhamomyces ciferrii]